MLDEHTGFILAEKTEDRDHPVLVVILLQDTSSVHR
jgi:hypothetical protein